MGYEYGFGRSPYLALMQGTSIYMIFVVIVAIAALVLSFFIFHKFVGKPEGSQLKQEASKTGFLERFLRFKQLIVGDVIRWGYIFFALLIAFEGVVTSIFLITLVTINFSFFVTAIVNLLIVVLIEVGLRVIYELRMLTVLIAKDTKGIRNILSRQYGPADDYSSQPQAQPQPQPQPQGGYQQYVGWTCPKCGCANNTGAFCRQCGCPKP